jgi:hypothetical protein
MVAANPASLSAAPFAAFAICGARTFLEASVLRFKSCWGKISQEQLFAAIIDSLIKTGCNLAGEFVFDFLLAVLTDGASVPASAFGKFTRLAEKLKKIKDGVDSVDPTTILGKFIEKAGGVEQASNAVVDIGKAAFECK